MEERRTAPKRHAPQPSQNGGAISGEGGSTQYVLAQLTSPNQDVASRRGGAKTNACGEQDETKDCYVLEGSLPEILEGWKWVKQAELATEPTEVAEAMVKQYPGKNQEVRMAIGQPSGDYLERVRRLTAGNCGKFRIEKVTERQVKNMIKKVDKKGSFGIDLISYKDIKLLEKYITKPLTEQINLSIETKYYPTRWKTARVKPLWKGTGNDRKKCQSHTDQ